MRCCNRNIFVKKNLKKLAGIKKVSIFAPSKLRKNQTVRSSSRLGRQVFILEIRGSSPLRTATNSNKMANHKSSEKRIRQTETKRLHNRYFAKTMRNALKEFRGLKEKAKAGEELPKLVSMIDKLSTKEIIHKNKAANLKSGVVKFYNAMK